MQSTRSLVEIHNSLGCVIYISRAASSVGVMYHFGGPNTGSNPGGGWMKKKKRLGKEMDLVYNSGQMAQSMRGYGLMTKLMAKVG